VDADPHETHRQQDRRRGAVEGDPVAAGQIRQDAADQRTDERPDELAGAEPAEGIAEAPFGGLARHQRDCRAGKTGEHPHQRAKREKLPDIGRHAHQRGEHADREARAQQHQLAAMTVGNASPERRRECRGKGCDPVEDSGPEVHRARRLDTELGQEQRHDWAQYRERHRHDELDADHDPERSLPLCRGLRLVLALNRVDALFDHAACGSDHRLVRPDGGFVVEAMIVGMGFARLRPLVTR